jgi:HK97 family phage prohead protease/HK97 family phage major capsid protein
MEKILRINSVPFAVKSENSDDAIYIAGYASTTDVDRHGDVVPSEVWERGLTNYLKNPVILAYHDHKQPVGRMVEYKTDSKGLWIKAKISAAAENVFKLIKDEILTAFSIGFRIVDAEYNQATELFVVKELELHEISVVSVPANQNTLFSLSKAFDNADEYNSFKMHFAPKSESAKGLESYTDAESTKITKEFKMDPEQIKQALADAARQGAEEATKSILAAQEKAAAEKAAAEKAERELEQRIKAAVSANIQTGETGAEKLLAEVEKRLSVQAEESKSVLAGLEAALKEKAAELDAMQRSKMQFSDAKAGDVAYAEKEKAVLLSKMTGKSIDSTKFGRQVIEKAGPHLPSNTWELEVSLRMEDEVRRRLVVAPTLRSIQMQTNVMTIPVNPEAGHAVWVTNAQFGTTNSAGGTSAGSDAGSPHALKEITLNAYKVATNEYLAYEEEEDSLLALMPVIRDAMVRRVARAIDRAMLRGAGAGADPVKGLAAYDAVSAVNLDIDGATVAATNFAKANVAAMRALRKDLGAWGLDPAELVYIVSTEVYYDLLDDETFQTVDKIGTQATLLTGQIGSIANTPVLVSAEFDAKASGAAAAICFAPANFLAGNQRGLRIDTQDLVETQRKVMVASLRTGMTQITTNLGGAVSTLRYVA